MLKYDFEISEVLKNLRYELFYIIYIVIYYIILYYCYLIRTMNMKEGNGKVLVALMTSEQALLCSARNLKIKISCEH